MQLLLGAGQCHIEHIDVIDVRIYLLAVVIVAECTCCQVLVEDYGVATQCTEIVVVVRWCYPNKISASGINAPKTRHDNNLSLQTFRLVDGRNLNGVVVHLYAH